MFRELNLACGRNRKKFYQYEFKNATHADKNELINPDVLMDCEKRFPFEDDWFDEIHAYHIIEHIGRMGEVDSWFSFWAECWRVLKPYGIAYIIAPYYLHQDAVGDPDHSRLICEQTFVFLDRASYGIGPDGENTAMTQYGIDFDFKCLDIQLYKAKDDLFPKTLRADLQAQKPAREKA